MSIKYNLGIYSYSSKINSLQYPKLPDELKIESISSCGILLELLMGKVIIYDKFDKILLNQKNNYTKLPYQSGSRNSYREFVEVLGVDITDTEVREVCNRCMIKDRRNNFVYEHVLNEITQYFVISQLSPCEGFVHLYRTLEFMSYSFPLIYASKTKKYQGTYEGLKKFFLGGAGTGELKFLSHFLKELFEDDSYTYNYEFEILFLTEDIEYLREDFKEAIKLDLFTFENDTLVIKFKNIIDIFVEIRNRYFHMLLGQGKNNFLDIRYDKNELFSALNPIFLNWLSVIFVKILQHGLSLYD